MLRNCCNQLEPTALNTYYMSTLQVARTARRSKRLLAALPGIQWQGILLAVLFEVYSNAAFSRPTGENSHQSQNWPSVSCESQLLMPSSLLV